MKSYTDLGQSLKLTEFLPLESADMGYLWNGTSFCDYPVSSQTIFNRIENIPCWSLAALFKVISNIFKYNLDYNGTSFILMVGDFEVSNKAAVDACVEMIEKLHEQKLL